MDWKVAVVVGPVPDIADLVDVLERGQILAAAERVEADLVARTWMQAKPAPEPYHTRKVLEALWHRDGRAVLQAQLEDEARVPEAGCLRWTRLAAG